MSLWSCLLLLIDQYEDLLLSVSVSVSLSVYHRLSCPVLFHVLLSHFYKNSRTQKPKLQKVQQSVRESSGHEAAEIGLGWNGIGG